MAKEADPSRKDVPRCVCGACKGGVAGERGGSAERGGAEGREGLVRWGVVKDRLGAWEGVVGGEGGGASREGVAQDTRRRCPVGQGREDVARGERPSLGLRLFLGDVACGTAKGLQPFRLGLNKSRGVPAGEAPERTGEDRG